MDESAKRLEKRVFEPPPWEREKFEELARQREERERKEREQARAEAVVLAEADLGDAAARTNAEPAPVPDETGSQQATEDTPRDVPIDEKRVQAMLVQLSGEEQISLRPFRRASRVIAVVVGIIGLAIIAILAVTGARSGSAGPIAATSTGIGLVIGASITGVAVWLWVKTAR